jgi:hypothetical protein
MSPFIRHKLSQKHLSQLLGHAYHTNRRTQHTQTHTFQALMRAPFTQRIGAQGEKILWRRGSPLPRALLCFETLEIQIPGQTSISMSTPLTNFSSDNRRCLDGPLVVGGYHLVELRIQHLDLAHSVGHFLLAGVEAPSHWGGPGEATVH